MTAGRKPQYSNRFTFTSSSEKNLYDDFKKTCERKHVDMNQIFQEWMTKFVDINRVNNKKMTEFLDEDKVRQIVEETKLSAKFSKEFDLENIDKASWVDFLHGLNLKHAASAKGLAMYIAQVSQLVIEKEKGKKPKIYASDERKEYRVPTTRD